MTAVTIEELADQIGRITGTPLDSRQYRRGGTTPWDQAAAVQELVTASGLAITRNMLTCLQVSTRRDVLTMTTAIPLREIAIAVADAASSLDQTLRTGPATSPLQRQYPAGASDLHTGLREHAPRIGQDLYLLARQDLHARTFGQTLAPTPVTDTLATFMLDATGGQPHATTRHDDVVSAAARNLVDHLIRRPDLLDVARSLENPRHVSIPTVTAAPGRAHP